MGGRAWGGPGAETEKGPDYPSDRTRPVGGELGIRCLLGIRAPPGSNPPIRLGCPDSTERQHCAWLCWRSVSSAMDADPTMSEDGQPVSPVLDWQQTTDLSSDVNRVRISGNTSFPSSGPTLSVPLTCGNPRPDEAPGARR